MTEKTYDVTVKIRLTVDEQEDVRDVAQAYADMATRYRSISAETSEVISIRKVKKSDSLENEEQISPARTAGQYQQITDNIVEAIREMNQTTDSLIKALSDLLPLAETYKGAKAYKTAQNLVEQYNEVIL